MCGRYLLFTNEEYEEITAIIKEIENNNRNKGYTMKSGEIFPSDIVPVITKDADDKPAFNLFKWGFPNFIQPNGIIINARGETLDEKQTFKKILYTKRCLIPACGFFEWKKNDKIKDKYLIKPSEHDFFYMAGLYNSFVDKTGTPYTGFVIITTEANKEMETIHNRMPVIMTSKEEAYDWISTSKNPYQIKTFITPYKNKLTLENLSIHEEQQLKFEM